MSKPERPIRTSRSNRRGFTLIELLVVMALVAILMVSAKPAFQWLGGAGSINKAITDLDQTIELARTHAIASHTYVRLVFSQLPANGAERPMPTLLVLALYPAAGTLNSTNDTAQSMADPAQWPLLTQALVLDNLVPKDSLNTHTPDTSADTLPSQSDMASSGSAFTRSVMHLVPAPSFTACIQVNPAGEIEVYNGTPSRYIKLGFDRPAPQDGRNPFILRVCGINGQVAVLRKEDGIQ